MTVIIEPAGVSSERVTRGISRYKYQNPIYYGENRILTFDTYNRKKYVPTGDEKVMLITKGIEYRPDLVAYDVYGVPDGWWKILEANNMKDVFEFKAGITILIPEDII